MTIDEVKKTLGEPQRSEWLGKLVKEPIDFPLYDEKGNPIDQEHIVKAVDRDLMLHFKLRRTTVMVRFDEDDRVKACYEKFDFR